MGWIRRAAKADDPIGDLCRLLADRPWEWSAPDYVDDGTGDDAPGENNLDHASGVSLSWREDFVGDYAGVWLAPTGAEWVKVPPADWPRVFAAIRACAVARVAAWCPDEEGGS